MARARMHLGDSHNFGRRVSMSARAVHKPRTLLWEWLLLSAKSPLRVLLDEAAAHGGLGRDAFSFLPDLAFSDPHAPEGGDVERIRLAPLPPRRSSARMHALSMVTGRALALFSWLGISDLHWENLALGMDRRGRIVLAPLDVEIILAALSSPTETKLLADADPEYAVVCQHACGVRRVLPGLGKPVLPESLVAMLGAYRATLDLLDGSSRAIARVLSKLPRLRDTPIRVCLRGTGDYVRARTEPVWPPLLDAEAEQLARGDVPYFFRLYGRRGIHYFADAALARVRTLPQKGDVPQSDPILSLSRGLRGPTREELRTQGLFAVIGAFDHPSFAGKVERDGVSVTFAPRTLVVRLPDGEELRTRRDLSAFVSSVYQPCRCGEVRSVLVPSATVCRPETPT